MHKAPPVVYPLGRSHFQGLLLLGLWLAGLLVLLLWWHAAPAFDWRLGMALAAALAAGAAALWGWKNSPIGQLRWDGQVWHWESQGNQAATTVLRLSVTLDLQRMLLLRLETHDHATLWLWADRSAMPERWLDLRRAVYSRPSKATPDSMPTEPLKPVAAADFSMEPPPPRPHP
jgi:toxin CptA